MRESNNKPVKRVSGAVKTMRVLFTLVLLLLTGTAIGMEFLPKLNTIEVPKDDAELGIIDEEKVNLSEEEAKVYKGLQEGVENILIIGVDEDGYDGGRSDVMIIASLDSNNKKLKLTSVMRDTYSYLPTSDTYQKLNHSYMEKDGPVETMRAINRNFDLNIRDFVVFDFDAVAKAVDYIGGYPVYMDAGEVTDMNNYGEFYEGENLLTGEQATLYMRIRYNSGDDQGRNQRQRDLIVYLLQRAKEMGNRELVSFAKEMMPTVRTSYKFSDVEKLLTLFEGMKDGVEMEQYSFPSEFAGTTLSDGLWYAVPRTMRSNVIQLHKDIYGFDDYTPSDNVDEISETIQNNSGVYPQ